MEHEQRSHRSMACMTRSMGSNLLDDRGLALEWMRRRGSANVRSWKSIRSFKPYEREKVKHAEEAKRNERLRVEEAKRKRPQINVELRRRLSGSMRTIVDAVGDARAAARAAFRNESRRRTIQSWPLSPQKGDAEAKRQADARARRRPLGRPRQSRRRTIQAGRSRRKGRRWLSGRLVRRRRSGHGRAEGGRSKLAALAAKGDAQARQADARAAGRRKATAEHDQSWPISPQRATRRQAPRATQAARKASELADLAAKGDAQAKQKADARCTQAAR